MADADIRISVQTDTGDSVTELQRVEAASKEAGEAVDRLDAETVSIDVDTSELRKLEADGKRTGSVMANLTGNAAQDIGAIAGVSGAAGVGLGQMAEGAAEGEINLKQLAGAAGPIAAVGVATEILNNRLEKTKAIDAFNTARIESFVTKLREGKDAAQGLLEVLEETETVQVNFLGDMIDAIPALNKAGINVEEYRDIVIGFADDTSTAKAELEAWRDSLVDQGLTVEEATLAYVAAGQELERMIAAEDLAAERTKFYTRETETATSRTRDHARELKKLNAEYDHLGGVTQDQIDANAAYFESLGELNAQYDDVTAGTDDWRDALQKLNEKYDDVEDKTSDAVDALKELSKVYLHLTGKWTAREGWLELLDSLEEFRALADSGEASWRELEQASIDTAQAMTDYVLEMGRIPASVKTSIIAQIDQGEFDKVEALLARLERRRNAPIVPVVAGERPGRQTIVNNYFPPAPTPAQVDEAGREYERINTGPVP